MWYSHLVVVYGVVYLIIGWLCLSIFGGLFRSSASFVNFLVEGKLDSGQPVYKVVIFVYLFCL